MRIVKPVYVNHDNIKENKKDLILSSIYSIDFHPNGVKFTTGGGSDKYGIIKIWNMDPIRSKEKEMDDTCPKILFEDFSHLKCVNAIKWSPSGKYLASGSIDAVIIIWIQKKLNELERKNKKFSESYRAAFQLRGHTQDIMDLAWSPHGSYLCSGSIDNKIIVWNAENFPEKAVILSGHTSFIKGVCWDPLGRYLASQSDDKTLRIWRTSDWKQEVKLQDEIDKSHSRCSFSRLAWSPDGSNVVATGTMNNGVPTSQLYNRDNWLKSVDMVGHRQHVICAKYFPTLLRTKATGETTLRRRPLTVVTDLFSMSIIDLSWFVEKFELLACSLDGSIAYLQFTDDELGIPLSSDEMTTFFEKTYGNGFVSETISMSKNKSFILPESCAVLEHQRKQRELLHNKAVIGGSLNTSEKSKGPSEQIVQRTQAGRKRITPKFLSSIDDDDMEPEPVVPAKKLLTTVSTSVPEQPCKTDIETNQSKEEDVLITDKTKLVTKHKLLEEKFVKPESPTISSSSEERRDSSNGKTKSTKSDDSNKSPRKEDSIPNKCQNSSETKNQKKDDKLLDQEIKTTKDVSVCSESKLPRRIQLYKDTVEKLNNDIIRPLDTSTITSLNVPVVDDSPKKMTREIKAMVVEKRPQLVQPVLKSGTSVVCLYPGENIPYLIKTVNESPNDCKLCKVVVSVNEQKVWDVTLSSSAAVVVHFRDKFFIGDNTGGLHSFFLKGGRLLAPFVLDAGIVSLNCDGKYLFAVTTKATLFIWSLAPLSLFLKESFLFLLTDDNDKSVVKDVTINNSDGNVTVVFESGSAYIFNKLMGVWHEVANNSNKLDSWSISRLMNKNAQSLPLANMQSELSSVDEPPKSVSVAVKTDLRIDRLEIQMKLSETLNSMEEYKYWLIMLMRTLIDANKECRVREICQELLGPINTSSRSSWQPFVQSLSKRELLKEILPLLALNLRLQHLYTEFSDQLDMLLITDT